MIDLHCHLLPYVDDGANDLGEARALLRMEEAQGVMQLCLTPHLRKGMFETPDANIKKQFDRLCQMPEAEGLKLHLSREYHIDSLFWEKLQEGSILPIGRNVILSEFSTMHSAAQIFSTIEKIRDYGYTPLIAHVERYPSATVGVIEQIRSLGALIQVNADAVLGYDGRYIKRFVHSIIKDGLVDAIASDAHSTDFRPLRMWECGQYLTKKFGADTTNTLLETNPLRILTGE